MNDFLTNKVDIAKYTVIELHAWQTYWVPDLRFEERWLTLNESSE
jgi:hypothetical protein